MFFTQKFWQDQTHFQVLISACFITSRKKSHSSNHLQSSSLDFRGGTLRFVEIFPKLFFVFKIYCALVLQTEEHCDLWRLIFPKLFLSWKSTLRVLLNSKSSSILDHEQMLNSHKSNFSTIYARKTTKCFNRSSDRKKCKIVSLLYELFLPSEFWRGDARSIVALTCS